MATARHGLGFIAGMLATIALLVAGLGITSWFSASQAAFELAGANTIFTEVSSSIKLGTIELCSNNLCVSAWTFGLEGSTFAKLAQVALGLGIGFGGLVAWAANRRISGHDVSRRLRAITYAAGAATIVVALVCLFGFPPDAISYDIATGRGQAGFLDRSYTYGLTTQPTLGIGGFLTIAGVMLGGFMLRPPRADDEPVEEPRPAKPVPRVELGPPPRGVETDPFRAPPAPPPIAVIKHERPATAPVVLDPDGEAPKILR